MYRGAMSGIPLAAGLVSRHVEGAPACLCEAATAQLEPLL